MRVPPVRVPPVRAPRPWRVAVLGNSVPILMVPPRQHRRTGTYSELLPELLAADGVDATVVNHARLFELVHEGARRFRRELIGTSPDVLVLHYGMLELQPNVLPTTLNRHLSREDPGGRGLQGLWIRHGVPRAWPVARTWQRWASARVGDRGWRLPPKRVAAELARLIDVARQERALVLVIDVHRPGSRLEHFLPGVGRRWVRMQAVLHDVVSSRRDPDVRLIPASAIVAELGEAGGAPDGLHLTAAGHRMLAELLAAEISTWVKALVLDPGTGEP